MSKIATVSFNVNDIKDSGEGTEEQVEAWLDHHYKYIEEAMLRAGWDAIDTLDSLDPIGG